MNTEICCKSTNQSIRHQASHENQPDLQSLEQYNFCILLVAGKDQTLKGTAVQTHWQIKQELYAFSWNLHVMCMAGSCATAVLFILCILQAF